MELGDEDLHTTTELAALAGLRYTHPPNPHSHPGHGTNVAGGGPHRTRVSNPPPRKPCLKALSWRIPDANSTEVASNPGTNKDIILL